MILRTGFILLYVLTAVAMPAYGDGDRFRGPWGVADREKPVRVDRSGSKVSDAESPVQRLALNTIRFFQNVISPADGDRCPMYPSCSHYAAQAIKKHGLILGTVMAAARLTQERGEMQINPKIWVNGSYRFYDPVENNDFWFIIQ